VVIAPGELASWSPIEMSNKGFPVVQYDKNDVEALGLVKLDLLGLRMHTAIQKALDQLEKQDLFIDSNSIPLDDERTFRLLRTTDTVGVFQVESPGQRQLLGRLQPKKFSDIIAEISLFRPGPMKGDMVTPYVQRRNHKEPVRYPHPDLEPILQETYGVVLFQEQVLKIAHRIAGFSLAEADQLRRAMTKNRSADEMERIKASFIQGAISQGHNETTALKIFAMVASFAGYGFCKAHAASFAHITYQSAFLKAHYPLAFYLGLLNAGHVGSYPKSVILNEAKRLGFEILNPHVNFSHESYTVENGGIRIGFLALNGFGPQFCKRLLREREFGPFTSIKDFCHRSNFPQDIILRLSLTGAFLGLPLNEASSE
jgi:DNA polymerase III alpha subunit